MNNVELVQQLAALNWILRGTIDENKDAYAALTGGQILYELYQRLSGSREIEKYRVETTLNIANFVKQNPKASEKQLVEYVQGQITEFAAKVRHL